MSFLSKVESGIQTVPHIYVLHSAPGVGKTTFASKFPKPIFADIEDGSKQLPIDRLGTDELPDYKTFLAFLDELRSSSHSYKTLVIDSATALESYIHRHLMGGNNDSIEKYDGGFGKGYTAAREELQKLINPTLRALVARGMDIIICAHSQVKPFTDPITNSTYDRYLIQTNAKFAEILTSAADNVFFLKHGMDTTIDSKTKKTQAYGDGKRFILTEWRPAYEAKNRLNLPSELVLDYDAFKTAVENSKPKSAAELVEDIKALCSKARPELATVAKQKVEEAKGDVSALIRIKQKVYSEVSVGR